MSECNHSPTVQLWALTNDNKCPVCLAARLAEAVAAAQTWENEAERRSRRYERAAARLAEAEAVIAELHKLTGTEGVPVATDSASVVPE